MDLPQDPRLLKLISSCGSASLRSQDFKQHLGFPLPKARQSNKDAAKSVDKVNEIDKLCKMSFRIFNALFDSYDTVGSLLSAAIPPSEGLLLETTAGMLSKYGHVIWSTSEPRLTHISEDYPRHLVYTNPEDFQKLVHGQLFSLLIC